jgi:hypothetical protein
MMFSPLALILADHVQQDLFDSARLDGRSTVPAASPRNAGKDPVRRSLRFLVPRSRPAV